MALRVNPFNDPELQKLLVPSVATPAADPVPELPSELPKKTTGDYESKYDDIMSGAAKDEGEIDRARAQKLSFMEVLPYLLMGKSDKLHDVREAKRAGDVAAINKNREAKIKQYLERKKFGEMSAESDLNSDESKLAQGYMSKLDSSKDWSGYSANQLKPYLAEYLKLYQADVKSDLAKTKAEDTAIYRGEKAAERKEKAKNQEKKHHTKVVNDALRSLQGFKRIGQAGQYVMANKRALLAEDAERVIKMMKDKTLKRDATIETELAATLATLMMGGNTPAQQTIEHFMSPTANKTLAGIFKYATGKPQNAMTESIVDHYLHQIQGQLTYWKGKRLNIFGSVAIMLEESFEKFPELEDRFNRSANAIFEERPYEKAGAQEDSTRQDPKIKAYAEQYKLSYEQALKIIENRKKANINTEGLHD